MALSRLHSPQLAKAAQPLRQPSLQARGLWGHPGVQGKERNSAPKPEFPRCLQQQSSRANLVKIKAWLPLPPSCKALRRGEKKPNTETKPTPIWGMGGRWNGTRNDNKKGKMSGSYYCYLQRFHLHKQLKGGLLEQKFNFP